MHNFFKMPYSGVTRERALVRRGGPGSAPGGLRGHFSHVTCRVLSFRMVVYSGDTNQSAVLYDSLRADSVPFEGVISDGSSIRIDFLAEEPAAATAFNIRFEGDVLSFWYP